MDDRKTRCLTADQMKTIRQRVSVRKNTDEMSLLIYLWIETRLTMRDLLGWFNNDPGKRRLYLNNREELLEDFANVPKLFPKTHQTYLMQWKRSCRSWVGVEGATFEMLRRKMTEDEMNKCP